MQLQISVITLGIADIFRSRRFYAEGFGRQPAFESEKILLYQMNGHVMGTWNPAWQINAEGHASFAL
ncbi:hypothetical protein K1X12_05180 [Hyphomonas sp. WL0036]|uniref:hypothetical protein n=1 Tax=Hyphomonas sediminis TaxID=2866160 RepID=UPI001C7E8088|nr:hypothetical protein [Hyphomonas sediminis]MBY9066280.1 hypothetical protein [Hyphomonas sediminis]